MRFRYHFQILTPDQRVECEYFLHSEVEKQKWYSIIFLELWNSEGLICTQ